MGCWRAWGGCEGIGMLGVALECDEERIPVRYGLVEILRRPHLSLGSAFDYVSIFLFPRRLSA